MTQKNKRRRARKSTKIPRLWLVIGSALLVLLAVVYILNLPIWQIKDVVVNGAELLSPEYVRGLSGIPLNENLFFADFSKARENLAKVPAIKAFRLYRMPPQTVLISVIEREPLATVVFKERSVVIDEEGIIINQNPDVYIDIPNLAALPVITGVGSSKTRLGKDVASLVNHVLSKLKKHIAAGQIQLDLGQLKEISFLLDDLLRVRLGSAEKIEEKMLVFEVLLDEVKNKWDRVEYIDVRYPDYPVIKFK